MRDVSSAFADALNGAQQDGLYPRRSILATVKDWDTGNLITFGIWTGDEHITTDVISAATQLPVSRSFYGGLNLKIGEIPRVSDFTIQTVEVSFSQIADIAQIIARGHDTRLAVAEVHEWLLAPSGIPVAPPRPVFLGQVDEGSIVTPAAGGEGAISFSVVSDAIVMLTRTNPQKRSHEGQKRRQDDEFGRYSNATAYSRIYWGEADPNSASPANPTVDWSSGPDFKPNNP